MKTTVALGIILLALSGLPLFLVISLASLAAFALAHIDTAAVAIEIYRLASSPTLVTIPLFTLAGSLMAASHTPQRLLRFFQALFGALPGGVAIMGLCACAFFTAFTGASGVTIIALGALLFPMLKEEGYSEKFSLGFMMSSGSLGLLFPPSLPIILYALVAHLDVEQLFKAGILPGFLLILILSGWAILNGKTRKQSRRKFSWKELRMAIYFARYEIPLPFVVLFAIYNGWTTVNETATLTVLYVIFMECFLYKDIQWQNLGGIIRQSLSMVGAILLILCCALGFTSYLISEEVPMKIFEFLNTFIHNKYVFLIFLNIFLLIVGCLMDIFSAIVVVVPLIIPIAHNFGIDPLHLAIIFLTNLEIGYLTPPVGMNLFIGSFTFKRSMLELYKASYPYLLLLILGLVIITYIPALSLIFIK
ncbi:MAG: TRAP transporter large permease subunit [Bacteriovoracaceae bacterium]|nr:TRAP transporter large permease subunit [Bacteriovoracaceae bacterium]